MGQTAAERLALITGLVGFAFATATGCGGVTEDGKATASSGGSTAGGAKGASSRGGSKSEGGAVIAGGGGDEAAGAGQAGAFDPPEGGRSTGSGGSGPSTGGDAGKDSGGSPTGGNDNTSTGGSSTTPTCVEGAPCTCKQLMGTTRCTEEGARCSCPPAEQCELERASCFEPCGGEPLGTWLLEDACLAGSVASASCGDGLMKGMPGDNDLRLQLLDGGKAELLGRESWEIQAQLPLSCLQLTSVSGCSLTSFYPAPLLFTGSSSIGCQASGCGRCDCAGKFDGTVYYTEGWTQKGTDLYFGSRRIPYCVQGDELWLGGETNDGAPKVAYKFKRQSCGPTPTPCSERTAEECSRHGDCVVGACIPKSGSVPGCADMLSEVECSTLQGCTWDPEGCSGTAFRTCDLSICGELPGCEWREP